MKVVEHIDSSKHPRFSFEIVPPPRGRSIQEIFNMVEALSPLHPAWIDVTAHASSAYYHEDSEGNVRKRVFRKRPGTIGICGVIQNRFKIDTVAHLLCLGFTREETEDALIELNFLGIENVLALRGDNPNYHKEIKHRSVNNYALDLVHQLHELKNGNFLDEITKSTPLQFCIGVAGYPEKHFEAANRKVDLINLKKKVDAGAEYIVTQMFFDNQAFLDFKKACHDFGINVPIIPGLKIIKNFQQMTSLPKTFHVNLPNQLVDEMIESPDHIEEIGRKWAFKQVLELLEFGEKNIHFYVMNDTDAVVDVVKKFI